MSSLFGSAPGLWLLSGADRVRDKCRLHRRAGDTSECNKEKVRELPRPLPGKSNEIPIMKIKTAGVSSCLSSSVSGAWIVALV